MKLHILFSCDEWHQQSTRLLLGVFEDKDNLISVLNLKLMETGKPPLSGDDIAMLHNFNQTQKYEGDGEFIIDSIYEGEINGDLL